MDSRIGDVSLHHVEHGSGVPLVALHGAGVDHREIEAALEAVVPEQGLRRVYPDLPGMGRSSAAGLAGNDDVVTLLGHFLDRLLDRLDAGPAVLAGHSYGAYLARGLAARRPDAVRGLALLCPVGAATGDVPEHRAVQQDDDAYDELDPSLRKGFDEYVVVRTRATARRYRDHVVPGTELVDPAALERVFAGWTVDLGATPFTAPTLVVAGRQDSTAGYGEAAAVAATYPRATLAVVDGAGHALPHERPALLRAVIADWLERVGVS